MKISAIEVNEEIFRFLHFRPRVKVFPKEKIFLEKNFLREFPLFQEKFSLEFSLGKSYRIDAMENFAFTRFPRDNTCRSHDRSKFFVNERALVSVR